MAWVDHAAQLLIALCPTPLLVQLVLLFLTLPLLWAPLLFLLLLLLRMLRMLLPLLLLRLMLPCAVQILPFFVDAAIMKDPRMFAQSVRVSYILKSGERQTNAQQGRGSQARMHEAIRHRARVKRGIFAHQKGCASLGFTLQDRVHSTFGTYIEHRPHRARK